MKDCYPSYNAKQYKAAAKVVYFLLFLSSKQPQIKEMQP